MANLNNTTTGGNAVDLPSGTTAQRPSNPQDGYMRFNTDEDVVEYYRAGSWRRIDDLVDITTTTGSPISSFVYDNDIPYQVYIWYGAGSFTPKFGGEIEYLVVAGGGGGGGIISGGAGAGGLLTGKANVSQGTTYTVSVGSGGTGGVGWNNTPQYGENGNDSSISGIVTATGGGYGAGHGNGTTGGSGGSGGGGRSGGGSGVAGQGFGGSTGDGDTGGAGGGAAEPGYATDSSTQTNNGVGRGGNGFMLSITGYPQYYAGGGGSGARAGSSRVAGRGGLGGGGTGTADTSRASDGAPGTGGGGGGAGYNASSTSILGGTGGSGVVVIRYKKQTGVGNRGPGEIHTQNLALHLDAGDLRSYNYADSNVNNTSGSTVYNIGGPQGSGVANFTLEGKSAAGNWSGQYGGCWTFTGSQWLDGDLSTIDNDNNDWDNVTIEMWCRRNDTSGAEYLWDARNDGGTWMLTEYSGYDWNWSNTVRYNDSNKYAEWHQHVAVCDGNESRLYRNGELKATGGNINARLGSNFHIGTRYTNSSYWNGQIAIFRVYKEALGDSAIKQNFEAQRGRFGI